MSRNPPTPSQAAEPDTHVLDVAVIGAGPAGEALVAALVQEGLAVGSLDPALETAWVPSYACWEDELAGLGLGSDVYEARWDSVRVHVEDAPTDVPRAYVRFHNERLRGALRARAPQAERVSEAVTDLVHEPAHTRLVLSSGRELRARVVVDATGHGGRFTKRDCAARTFQAAFGLLGRLGSGPAVDVPVWMDFRALQGDGSDAPPTFLYALPLPDGRVLLEETSLLAAPALSMDILEERLRRRMAERGWSFASVDATERCLIPMDTPVPAAGGRVVAFGGAAGMVHPATGFLVAASLRAAPGVAKTLAEGLRAGQPPEAIAASVARSIWSPARLRGRDMHLFGVGALAAMSASETRTFFQAFFALPPSSRDSFLSADYSAGALAGTMLELFLGAPMAVRRLLAARGLGHGWRPLTRAALGAPLREVIG